ncbi:MAG: glycosyltransferase [bacterium]
MNKPYDVIMLAMSTSEDWAGGINNRNWQVLKRLLDRDDIRHVLLVDVLPWRLRRTVKYLLSILFSPSCKISHPKLIHYRPLWSWINSHWDYKKIQALAERYHFQNVILWSYLPMFTDYGPLRYDCLVFDMVDDWTHHPSYGKIKNKIEESYCQLEQKANVIFVVNETLKKKFPLRIDIHYLPNGVETELFAKEYECPTVLRDIQRPIIGYSGTVQERFDQELVYESAKKHPDWSFVILGWVWRGINLDKLRSLPNVHFLGRVEYKELPMFIRQWSVGIIPHKQDAFYHSNDPMKLYEYLAAGLPVVTTDNGSLEDWKDVVKIANEPEEFVRAIEEAIREDNWELRKERQRLVQQASWDRRVSEMMEYINFT